MESPAQIIERLVSAAKDAGIDTPLIENHPAFRFNGATSPLNEDVITELNHPKQLMTPALVCPAVKGLAVCVPPRVEAGRVTCVRAGIGPSTVGVTSCGLNSCKDKSKTESGDVDAQPSLTQLLHLRSSFPVNNKPSKLVSFVKQQTIDHNESQVVPHCKRIDFIAEMQSLFCGGHSIRLVKHRINKWLYESCEWKHASIQERERERHVENQIVLCRLYASRPIV